MVPRDRKRGNGHILKCRKFHLNVTRIFFTVKIIKHCSRLARVLVESLSLQTLKMQLDATLSKYSLAVPAMSRDV